MNVTSKSNQSIIKHRLLIITLFKFNEKYIVNIAYQNINEINIDINTMEKPSKNKTILDITLWIVF